MIVSSDSFSDKTTQIVAYTAVSMFKRNPNLQNKILEKLPIISYLFDDNNCIEINDVLPSLREAMEHYGELCITVFGQRLKFNSSDIDVLSKYFI